MKKRIILLGTICATLLFFTFAQNPLQTLLNFAIAGIVPGLDFSLGFLPSIALVISLAWLMHRGLKSVRHQSIKHHARLNKIENEAKEFAHTHSGEEVIKKTSVIAAPSTERVQF